MNAKDILRENRKRKNSSKNTSKLPWSFVTTWGLANCPLASKADKAAAAAAAVAPAPAPAPAPFCFEIKIGREPMTSREDGEVVVVARGNCS